MWGKITQVKKEWSKLDNCQGYYVFFKLETGKSARSFVSSANGNFKLWEPVLAKVFFGEGVALDGLNVTTGEHGSIVDADSPVRIRTDKTYIRDDEPRQNVMVSCDECKQDFAARVKQSQVQDFNERMANGYVCEYCRRKKEKIAEDLTV